ncbi:DUF1996 domain-containing protein [Serratia proteamaculans]|nr:DUF1996 domain-containing protein [Serratia proteamaculans]
MMAFGRPGESMVHDFFGNKEANAYSTVDSLMATPDNTCTSMADGSAYWAPQLLNTTTGEIIKPDHMKTYYRNADTRYPVVAFPKGLQLMVGEHESSSAKQGVLYFCKTDEGGHYTRDPLETCPTYGDGRTQFNLAFSFPNCWDGKHLAPPHHGPRNAVYDVDGVCPADYPVKIPLLQMNIAYVLPNWTKLSTLRLSMNPTITGGRVEPKWGSLYTAHADFFNGWREETLKYVTGHCLNSAVLCNKNLPSAYEPAIADSYTLGGEFANTNYGSEPNMLTQYGTNDSPEIRKTAYFKFKLPDEKELDGDPYQSIVLRFFSSNPTSNSSHMIRFYETSTGWDEETLTQRNAPFCGGKQVSRSWVDAYRGYRNSEDITNVVKAAWARGANEISFCATTNYGIEAALGTHESEHPAFLFFNSQQKATAPAED